MHSCDYDQNLSESKYEYMDSQFCAPVNYIITYSEENVL